MSTQTTDLFTTLCVAYSAGAELVMLFDFDGTLAAIVEHPKLAVLPIEARLALETLNRLPGIHVGVVSGRELSDLRKKVAIPDLLLAGTSGLELEFRGVRVTHPSAGAAITRLKDVANSLRDWPILYPGLWIETKRLGITIHFRQVCSRDVESLVLRLREALTRFEPSMQIGAGPMAIEITPALGWTKGSAVRMFLNSIPATQRLMLYAGDSHNDVDAFKAISQAGGISVGVGADVPGFPSFRFSAPAELHAWLASLAISLSQVRHPPEVTSCS